MLPVGWKDDDISERLLDQRMRNRIMEALVALADGNRGVRREWPDEYFCSFYDWIPHRDDGGMYPNGAITEDEKVALIEVTSLLDDACDSTPQIMTADEFIATGWPERIQPVATRSLDRMRHRGRFREDAEEAEPSRACAKIVWGIKASFQQDVEQRHNPSLRWGLQ